MTRTRTHTLIAVGNGWQAWAKPLGRGAHALLLLGTAARVVTAELPLSNVSAELGGAAVVCVRDLYAGAELPPRPGGDPIAARLPVHDSVFYCLRARTAGASCEEDLGGCPDVRRSS